MTVMPVQQQRPWWLAAGELAFVVLALLSAGGTVMPWPAAGAADPPSRTASIRRAQSAPSRAPVPRVAPVVSSAVPRLPTVAAPARLEIPSIHVDTSLVLLGLNPDGTLEVPSDFDRAGWYRYGPSPGAPGPAVVAGHVDSTSGPAVFFDLHRLRVGDAIYVTRDDESRVSFTVERVEQFAKDAFPTDRVFGPVVGAELHLITCGGTFDWNRHHYRDNVVVFAGSSRFDR